MKKYLFVIGFVLLSYPAQAQFGNLVNNLKNNPLLTQQAPIQDIVGKIQSISSLFSKMPLDSGKLEFIKAALPLLTQAQSLSTNFLSTVQQGKPADSSQTSKIGGLLDQAKALLVQKWSSAPLTPAQASEAANQGQQLTTILTSLLKNEGDALKGLAQLPAAH